MSKEIEAKVLDIDIDNMRTLLVRLGARPLRPMFKERCYVFDILPRKKNESISLRNDGETTTLTVVVNNPNTGGISEYETEVSDLRTTLEILRILGYKPKAYQENYQEPYELGKAIVSIDQWPKLKPYLDIEVDSKEDIAPLLKKLNHQDSQITSVETEDLYEKRGLDLNEHHNLIFSQSEHRLITTPKTQ